MEPKTFLALADRMAGLLPPKKGAELLDLVAERAVWAQMALFVSDFLEKEMPCLTGEARTIARQLIDAKSAWLATDLDRLIYGPAGEIARDLEEAGLSELGRKLAFDLSGASTGGEAVMGLNLNLKNALKHAPKMPVDIRSRIEFLLRRLETLDGGWVAPRTSS